MGYLLQFRKRGQKRYYNYKTTYKTKADALKQKKESEDFFSNRISFRVKKK